MTQGPTKKYLGEVGLWLVLLLLLLLLLLFYFEAAVYHKGLPIWSEGFVVVVVVVVVKEAAVDIRQPERKFSSFSVSISFFFFF